MCARNVRGACVGMWLLTCGVYAWMGTFSRKFYPKTKRIKGYANGKGRRLFDGKDRRRYCEKILHKNG